MSIAGSAASEGGVPAEARSEAERLRGVQQRSELGAERSGTVNLQLNGETTALGEDAVVLDAVTVLTAARTGVAVAVNGEVVPRGEWSTTPLRDGDRVEVLTATQGG